MSLNESQLMHNQIVAIMQTPITEWDIFKQGIIDEDYRFVVEGGTFTPFKDPLMSLARIIKFYEKMGGEEPVLEPQFFYKVFMESRNLVPQTDDILEAEVIGDSGYDAENIASGVTSGDVVSAGAQTMPKKKKKKSSKED